MLGNNRVRFALALTLAAAAGCGGSSNESTTGTAGKGGDTTTTTEGGSGGSTTSSSTTGGSGGMAPTCAPEDNQVLAVSELYFGEGDSGQWKKVGFDLDGLTSTANSKDLCQPSSGATNDVPYPDGDAGIDNSFGKNLLPLLVSLYMNWGDNVNAGIYNGTFTSLLEIDCLPKMGDAPILTSKLYGGTSLVPMPLWDGTDKWPVAPELLSDPKDPTSSTVIFNNSSVMGNKYDAGKGATFILSIPLKTQNGDETSIKLTLYNAHTTMTLADDHQSATDGMIGGVLNTEDLVAEVKKVGELLNLCGTDVFDNIIAQVRQSSDIMADGTQDPSKTCDGISFGLGFKMQAAHLGDVGPVAPVGMSCP